MAFEEVVQDKFPNAGPHARRSHTLDERPDLGEELAEYIRKGLYFESACARVGVFPRAVYRWLTKGRQDIEKDEHETKEARLWYAVTQAEAEFEEKMHEKLDTIGNDPRAVSATTFRLERRLPQKYGKQDRTQLEIRGQMAVGIATLPDDLRQTLDTEGKVDAAKQIGQILAEIGSNGGSAQPSNDSNEWEDASAETSFALEPGSY